MKLVLDHRWADDRPLCQVIVCLARMRSAGTSDNESKGSIERNCQREETLSRGNVNK